MPIRSVTVLIPTLNRDAPLCDTLRYFLEIEDYPDFQVMVLDQSDGHDEATRDFLERAQPRIEYVHFDIKSKVKALNHGLRSTSGEIVVVVDDDVEPRAGYLAAHVRAYEDPGVGGVTGPGLLPGQVIRSRAEVGEREYQRLMSRKSVRFDVGFAYEPLFLYGCNMSFTRAVADAIGGYDEGALAGVSSKDDAEISHRIKKAGYRLVYDPAVFLLHHNVPSGGIRDQQERLTWLRDTVDNELYFQRRVEWPLWYRVGRVFVSFRRLVVNRSNLRRGPRAVLADTRAFLAGVRGYLSRAR